MKTLITSLTLCFAVVFCRAEEATPLFFEDFSDPSSALSDWKMKDATFFTVSKLGHLNSQQSDATPTVGCSSPAFPATADVRISFDFQLRDCKELQYKINYAGGGHICRFVISSQGFYLRVNTNNKIPITKAFNMESVTARRNFRPLGSRRSC